VPGRAERAREPIKHRPPAVPHAGERDAVDRHGHRGPVAYQGMAAVIDDLSPHGRENDPANVVLGGGSGVMIPVQDLDLPQAPEEDEEQRGYEEMRDEQTSAGQVSHDPSLESKADAESEPEAGSGD
jgi:hypothetical protein